MIRASVAAFALAAGLFLGPAQGSAQQVWPGSHLASLDSNQQGELFQVLLANYDPMTAQIALRQAIALQPGQQPHLSVHDREDAPAEFPGVVAVAVLGNTVSNADILTVGPANNYGGAPAIDLHLSDGTRVFVWNGAVSTSPLHLRVTMDVTQ
jgi:hypothetical protein